MIHSVQGQAIHSRDYIAKLELDHVRYSRRTDLKDAGDRGSEGLALAIDAACVVPVLQLQLGINLEEVVGPANVGTCKIKGKLDPKVLNPSALCCEVGVK